MAIGEVLRLTTGLGPAVTLIALIFAIGIGIGILILTVKNLSRSLAGQNESFMQAIVELRKESDKRDERIEQLIGEQGIRISYIETRYSSKEDMYEALGGWKHEVSELRKRIDRHVEQHKGEKT